MQKKRPRKVLGVDYGTKRIGLALSDERKIIASPLTTFPTSRSLKETVNQFVQWIHKLEAEQGIEIEAIVVGMPYKMSGKGSLMSDEVKLFNDLLKEKLTIPIIAQDERLTTALAEKSLKEAELNRKRRAKIVDTIAASLVLQSYLDGREFTI